MTTPSFPAEPPRPHVTVVGGAGAMGRYAVRALSQLGSARRIVVADLDVDRARRVAEQAGSSATAVQVDATDLVQLAKLFADSDVVLNTMGPFAKFGETILRAALTAGCDYLDIDDDWESTLDAYELDGLARENGCRAVIGLGASPGTSNMLAAVAAGRLDSVEELLTGWSLLAAVMDEEPTFPRTGNAAAAAEHWLLQCTGTIRAWVEGRPSDITPLERVDFEYPGVGAAHAYTMGHPEPVTLPRTFHGVRRSLNLQSGPPELFASVRATAEEFESGRLSLAEAARRVGLRPDGDGTQAPMSDPLPSTWALARGLRAGVPLSVSAHLTDELPGRMGGHTGIPLAVGVELLRRGLVAQPGVHAPEAVIDPHQYFDLLRRFAARPVAAEEFLIVREQASTETDAHRA
ncbi:saccharopine dehydrogenase NADP-binding domain-containing protein [Streptomyces brevispora]|uniref:saccharopine dehydrogenase family protein n=1 Tax=Streptomyces brevispora TaxID=887462 RepID=UPI002E348EBD|nr:saccharopine dehydrogenase NADP-binding domain-containing protein [Streptomyces brevispora]